MRRRLGVTQAEVAGRMGVTQGRVSAIEHANDVVHNNDWRSWFHRSMLVTVPLLDCGSAGACPDAYCAPTRKPGATELRTLAAYVEALGGRLEIVADFGDQRLVFAEPGIEAA